LRPTI